MEFLNGRNFKNDLLESIWWIVPCWFTNGFLPKTFGIFPMQDEKYYFMQSNTYVYTWDEIEPMQGENKMNIR